MMSFPSDDEASARLFDFVALYLNDVEAGGVRTLAEYQTRFPGAEAAVAREFARQEARRELAGSGGGNAGAAERISHYRLVRRVGIGGQAVVFLAEDERTGRAVALKVLEAPTAALLGARRRRLEREARVLDQLEHPGLCGIEEVALDHDPPYLAMRFVEGETLRRSVVDHAPRLAGETDFVLELVERVARALHVAHEAGIVHRDVKPDNVMVTPEGTPVVVDFGLARLEQSTSQLTRPGEACGTLAYMAPEQLDESVDVVDRRADVYALGVTSFECLTGTRPFDAPTRARLAHSIRVESVPDPRRWNSAISRDLRTVLETAMEKNPARRYDTALAFADDLHRLRRRRRITARPPGVLVHLGRFGRRHPTFSLSAGLAFALLATGLFVVLGLLAEVRAERDAKELALRRVQGLVYAAAAVGKVLEDDPTMALGLAIEAGRRAPGRAANDALYAALDAGWELRAGHPPTMLYRDLALDPVRGEFVVVVGTRFVRWYGFEDGRLRREMEVPAAIRIVRVAADGTVAAGGDDGTVVLVHLGAERPVVVLPPGDGPVVSLAFDPGGRRLVVARKEGPPWLLALREGAPPIPLDGHDGPASRVAFAPDGEHFLTGSEESIDSTPDSAPRVLVRSAKDGAVRTAIAGHRGELRGARFSPDSSHVLTWGNDRTVRLQDAADGRAVVPPLLLPGAVHQAEFSPDGTRIATAFDAGTAVFDAGDGRCIFRVDSPTERAVFDVSFSPDGRRLATASLDRTARILDAGDGRELRVLRGHHTFTLLSRFSPDASRLVTQENSGEFHVFHLDSRPHLPILSDGSAPLVSACYAPAGDLILTASDDGTTRVFDATTTAIVARPEPHAGAITAAFFTPDGTRVVTAAADGTAHVSAARTGGLVRTLRPHDGAILCVTLSPDGRRLLTGGADGRAIVHDLETGEALANVHVADADVTCVRFAPDGATFVTGSADRTVRLFDTLGGGPGRVLIVGRRVRPSQVRVFAVEFHPAGHAVAVAFEGGDTVLVDVDGARVVPLGSQSSPIGALRFDSSGRRVLGLYKWGGRTYVFDTASGELLQTLFGHSSSMTAIDASPDGMLLVTASLDTTARLWRVADGSELATIAGHSRPLVAACFSPDGLHVLTASKDGRARLWPTDPLPTAERVLPRALTPAFLDALLGGG